MNRENYKKFGAGIFIVKSKNSNFNSDFTGSPRRLPDENGTIYATDKALKYCIRKYIHDLYPNEKVFVWRRRNEDGQPFTIADNYKYLFKIDVKEKLKKSILLKNLMSCIDVRLFGVTFAQGNKKSKNGKKKNEQNENNEEEKEIAKNSISITGPIQISYGINKLSNIDYTDQILGAFSSKDKNQQSTIGSQSRALESWYAYDIIINPNNSNFEIDDYLNKDNEEIDRLSENDIKLFKEALCKSVTYVNSCSKINSESAFLLYIESNNPIILPSLKDQIEIKEENSIKKINLTKVFELLDDYKKSSEDLKVEVYYNPKEVKIEKRKQYKENICEYNIINCKKIENED